MISILLATRNRVADLHTFLDSIQETCSDVHNIKEVLLRIDDDDIETIQFVEKYRENSNLFIKSIIGKRGKGYAEMDKMVKELCDISEGKFIYGLNDDAQFVTKDWDTKIINTYDNIYTDNIYEIRTSNSQPESAERPLFIIITRHWYDVLGHFAPTLETDTSLYYLNKLVNRVVFLKDIKVNHNHPDYSTGLRDGKIDMTYTEGRMALDSGQIHSNRIHVFSPEGYAAIVNDAIKLNRHIKALKDKERIIYIPMKLALIYWRYSLKFKLYYHINLPKVHYVIKYYNHFFLGSSMFCNADFKDLTNLAVKLRTTKDPISKYIFEHFSVETQQLLDKFDETKPISKALQKVLVNEFNQALQDDRFYDEKRFISVILKADEIRELINQNPKGKRVIRFNRLLLEETYPREIIKSHILKLIVKNTINKFLKNNRLYNIASLVIS